MIEKARAVHKLPAIGRWALVLGSLALVFGCGDAETSPVYIGPGTGGSTGSGGASGMGGISGTGGITGTGGAAGTGGTGSIGGTGGTGGVATKSICLTPLDANFCSLPGNECCDTDLDCVSDGYVCVDSGCTSAGAPIKQCQPSRGGFCVDESDCPNASDPNASDYECMTVLPGGKRCVRVTPGCNPDNETYDCPPGFSCEGEPSACVDRRMPCDRPGDCPKSHACTTTPISQYCTRTHRTCKQDADCGGFAIAGSHCADVDDDGREECVGELDDSGEGCVNINCGGSDPPVCEIDAKPITASCGHYGLCLIDNDCGAGFICAALWQDGRKECVLDDPGAEDNCISEPTRCPPQQVCAAPRDGGPPSCQSGSGP